MDIAIPIQDLFMFLIFCLLITAGVFFIIMISKLTKLISQASKLLETNADNINKTLTVLPEVAENLNDVTQSVKTGISTVEDTISETAATVSAGTENILDFVKIVSGIIDIVLNKFVSTAKK